MSDATAAQPIKEHADPDQWHARLLALLRQYFGEDDIRLLAFNLKLDYDDLPGLSKTEKTISLVEHCIRSGTVSQLIDECRALRPPLDWAEIQSNARAHPVTLDTGEEPNFMGVHVVTKARVGGVRSRLVLAGALLLGLGVIGLLARALLPTPPPTAQPGRSNLEELRAENIYGTFLAAAQKTGQVEAFDAPGGVTIFAPIDSALAEVSPARITQLQTNATHVRCHTVVGQVKPPAPGQSFNLVSIGGCAINFRNEGGTLRVNNASAAFGSATKDGHVYPIDQLLSPGP